MARNVRLDFRRGGGSSLEVLYGKVSLTPTNLHTLSSTAVLPAPTTFDLVNGTALATNVAPTPAPVDGLLPWGYKVKITDNFGKTWEYLVGVPDGTTEINFNVLPRYSETRPPAFGVGPAGPAGQSATIAVGTTTSGAAPAVTNTGTSTDAVLNFQLPKGDKGDTGAGVHLVTYKTAAQLPDTYSAGVTIFTIGGTGVADGWPAGFAQVVTERREAGRTTQRLTNITNTIQMTRTEQNNAWLAWRTVPFDDLATPLLNGLMPALDKAKLDGMTPAANSKTFAALASTYQAGFSVLQVRAADGWPIPTTGTIVTQRNITSSASTAQWLYSVEGGSPQYRVADVIGNWSNIQTVANTTQLQPSVNQYPSLEAAVTANAGKQLVFSGDYSPTANIPGFWDVMPTGTGTITREGITFNVNPRPAETLVPTNNIYVNAATGDDANDGLSPSYALKTLGQLNRQVIRRLTAEQAAGAKWVVNLAGTFTTGIKFEEIPDFPHNLEIQGEPLVADSPVTEVSKGTSNSTIGIWIEPGITTLVIRRLRISGFANGSNGYAILMKAGGTLKVEDCTAIQCDIGFAAIRNVDFTFTRCKTGNTTPVGFWTQYSSSGTFQYCDAIGSTNNGFSISRNAVVHIDYCNITGCATGVNIDMASRANLLSSHFKRNQLGVRVSGAAEWINASNNFYIGTSDANTEDYKHFGVGRETRLYSETSRNEYLIGSAWSANGNYVNPQIVTGTTANTLVYTGLGLGELPENFFTSVGKRIRVEVYGRGTLTADARLRLYSQVSGTSTVTELGSVLMRSVMAGSEFKAEFTVWAKSATSQGCQANILTNNNASSANFTSTDIDYTTARAFRLYVLPGNAADTITIYNMQTYLMG